MDVSRDKDGDPDKNYRQHYPSSNLQLFNSRHEYLCIWKTLNLWTPGEKSANKKLYFCNFFKIWVGRALENTKLYGDDSHELMKKLFGKKNSTIVSQRLPFDPWNLPNDRLMLNNNTVVYITILKQDFYYTYVNMVLA